MLLVAFLVNEALVRKPWADVKVLFSRNIGITLAILLLYTLTGLSNSSLVPNFLGTITLLRPEQSGVLLLTYGALPMLVLVPSSIYFLRHVDSRLGIVIGFAAFAAANLLGTQLTHVWARENFILIVMLQSVGQAFLVLPIIVTSLANSDPTRATVYAAYIQIMRLGGAEIGIALMGTWLRVREQINSAYLGPHVQSGDPDVMRVLRILTNHFTSYGAGSAQGRAISTLAAEVQREANVLAYIDGFWLCFYFAIAGLALTALLTAAPRGPLSPTPFGLTAALRRMWPVPR
jgi:DHA2 family multidrug resistance protein